MNLGMLKRLFLPLSIVLGVTFAVLPAGHAADPLQGVLSHRVIPGWSTGDGARMAGLELRLAPGWKTYWRSPGDAGIPPEFDWRGAGNLAGVHVHWPAPEVFWQSGMRSVGYSDRVVLPLTVYPNAAHRDVRLRGDMHLGICSDICVPATLSIDAVLPAANTDRSPAIVAALAALPYDEDEAGVRRTTCKLSPTEDGVEIEAKIEMPSAGQQEDAVIEAPSSAIWVSEPETRRKGDRLIVSAEMVAPPGHAMVLDRSRIRITVIGSRHAVDIVGCDS